ncbi:PAAR domain-containing protein, partial [Acinetobacter baumannii]
HTLATLGSATRLGGKIATASSSMHVTGHRIACVGDIVRYEDGTESRIISGAGAALTCKGHPMAIVGSTTDNGDAVTGSLQS